MSRKISTEREQFWRHHLDQQRGSRLSIRNYCIRPVNYRVLSVVNVGTSSGPGLVSRLSGRTGEFRWMGWAWLSEPQPNDGERSLPSPGNRLREARQQTEWAHW